MGWWGWLGRRLDVLFRKERTDAELDEEFRFHLEMEIREHERSGVSPAEARRRALVAFGGVERFKEEVRDVRGGRVLDDLGKDVSVAARSLLRRPAFLVAVLATLGVGIGGNVAMFAVLDASVFSSLPYPDADRLVTGRSTFNDGARLGPMLSGYDLFDYRDQSRSFDAVGAIAPFPARATVTGAGETDRADVVVVVPGFFQALGVRPLAGRGFAPAEGQPGAARVVILSAGYWQDRLGADPAAVGSTLTLNGDPHTVVGVMPPAARFMVDADLWVPAVAGQGMAGSRSAHNFLMVARLAADATVASAQRELDAISGRLEAAYPDSNEGKGIVLTPARDMLVESYRSTLSLLVGAVALLLVVACANVAGLLLARGQARLPEMAVRSVMGAGRGRLARQLLTESALLALGGGAIGLLLAVAGQRVLLSFVSMERLGTLTAGLSGTSVAFALGLSLATVLLFGAVPALRTAAADASVALRGHGKVAGSRGAARLRSGLVVAQVALTAVLLSVSGLLGRSLQELRSVELGFDASGLLTAELDLPAARYGPDERIAFFDDLRSRLAALPGVRSVALADQLPLRDPGNNWGLGLPGALSPGGDGGFLAHQRVVHPGYFQAMGIPLVAGRDIDPADRHAGPASLVVSERAARRLFGDASALGRLVGVQGRGGEVPHRIVGVVGDVSLDAPRYAAGPAMYYAYHARTPTRMRLALRHDGPAAPVAAGARAALLALDPGVPLDRVETMDAVLERATADERSLALLVAMFGGVALLLAGVGLYGVLAYQVTRRFREIGIRMALGASVSTVSSEVVRGGLALVGVGLLAGVPLSLLAARVVGGFLFGVEPADPATYAGVAAFVGLVAAGACLLPARRAARVDPVEAFRAE